MPPNAIWMLPSLKRKVIAEVTAAVTVTAVVTVTADMANLIIINHPHTEVTTADTEEDTDNLNTIRHHTEVTTADMVEVLVTLVDTVVPVTINHLTPTNHLTSHRILTNRPISHHTRTNLPIPINRRIPIISDQNCTLASPPTVYEQLQGNILILIFLCCLQ